MDRFWRVLRIGCISIFAIMAFGVACCTAVVQLDNWQQARNWDSLVERVSRLQKIGRTVATVGELFGQQNDGVCMYVASISSKANMQKVSPPEFAAVIEKLSMRPTEMAAGSNYQWNLFAVRNDSIQNEYHIMAQGDGSSVKSDPSEICHGRNDPVSFSINRTGDLALEFVSTKVQDSP